MTYKAACTIAGVPYILFMETCGVKVYMYIVYIVYTLNWNRNGST